MVGVTRFYAADQCDSVNCNADAWLCMLLCRILQGINNHGGTMDEILNILNLAGELVIFLRSCYKNNTTPVS